MMEHLLGFSCFLVILISGDKWVAVIVGWWNVNPVFLAPNTFIIFVLNNLSQSALVYISSFTYPLSLTAVLMTFSCSRCLQCQDHQHWCWGVCQGGRHRSSGLQLRSWGRNTFKLKEAFSERKKNGSFDPSHTFFWCTFWMMQKTQEFFLKG